MVIVPEGTGPLGDGGNSCLERLVEAVFLQKLDPGACCIYVCISFATGVFPDVESGCVGATGLLSIRIVLQWFHLLFVVVRHGCSVNYRCKLSLGVIATVPYRSTSPSLLSCSVIPCCNDSQPLGNHPLQQFGPHPLTTTSPQPPATIPSGEPIHRGPPPTQLRASYFTHRRITSSPASRVAEEKTEEETEPLEASPFWAATALMGTRLRSLEEVKEIDGGGGHGDSVPDGDGGGGGDRR
ncbi:hypothetical protein TIFTF001_036199 [Ficus carica]|uniref:Uncharacterized protein n=1 Tax=Ficus carica TaxID=3494 RepID=A0AA88E3U1_FICCA|nr:hypothetical protein TIFTF001_036199 [Ficus carica]